MPSTEECKKILNALKELGGSATTAEIAVTINEPKEKVTRFIQSMRRFGMIQAKCELGTGYGLEYELKDNVHA